MEEKNNQPVTSKKRPKKGWKKLWASIYDFGGPHLAGTWNWLFFTMLVLLAIVLLGGFLYVPLAAVLTAAMMEAFFGTMILTLKVGAFIGFALTLTMGITAMVNGYYEREKGNRNYFWLPYLKEVWDENFDENFVSSEKRTANLIKLTVGLLLFALVVALVVCTSGIGLTIPVVSVVVNFTAAAFATTSIFAGSTWFTALFLGVLVMTAYEVVCNVVESFLADDEVKREVLVKREGNNSYTTVGRTAKPVDKSTDNKDEEKLLPTSSQSVLVNEKKVNEVESLLDNDKSLRGGFVHYE